MKQYFIHIGLSTVHAIQTKLLFRAFNKRGQWRPTNRQNQGQCIYINQNTISEQKNIPDMIYTMHSNDCVGQVV